MERESCKQFYLNPGSERAAEEFIDLLDTLDLEKVDIITDYGLGRLRIKIYGPSPFVKKAYKKILKNYKVIENKYKKRKGFYKYVVPDMEEYLNIKIPLKLLTTILKDLKFSVLEDSETTFRSNADYDKVIDLISEINYYFRVSKPLCGSRTLRDLVTRIAIVKSIDPCEILENCLEKNLLRLRDDGKYELAASPSKILKQYDLSEYDETSRE